VESLDISKKLYEAVKDRAAGTSVAQISIGLGYTAVATEDGGVGLACTMLDSVKTCMVAGNLPDFEGQPAIALLNYLIDDTPIRRSLALALVNALNHGRAMALPEDRTNAILFDQLGIGPGARVAMVGHFGPIIKKLTDLGAEVDVLDHGRQEGDEPKLLKKLQSWADALIMTSTTLINGTAEAFLSAVGAKVRVAMLGPSTPMISEPFKNLPVHLLGGTVPTDFAETFKSIRHGRGTPVLQKYAKKVYLLM
jgi:uncharacterized protein